MYNSPGGDRRTRFPQRPSCRIHLHRGHSRAIDLGGREAMGRGLDRGTFQYLPPLLLSFRLLSILLPFYLVPLYSNSLLPGALSLHLTISAHSFKPPFRSNLLYDLVPSKLIISRKLSGGSIESQRTRTVHAGAQCGRGDMM